MVKIRKKHPEVVVDFCVVEGDGAAGGASRKTALPRAAIAAKRRRIDSPGHQPWESVMRKVEPQQGERPPYMPTALSPLRGLKSSADSIPWLTPWANIRERTQLSANGV
jgi:hypothetical protein